MCVLIFLTEEKQPLFVSWCNDESDWSPDYGYYRLEDRYSMDQTRLTLADPAAGTWRFGSGDSARVAQRKCADKGRCTLHLCKSGDITKPQPRDMVIFKGQGHVSEVEKLSYDDRIFVAWSQSSYINSDLQDEYAEEFQRHRLAHFKKDVILGEAACVHPSLVVVDSLRNQVTQRFMRAYDSSRATIFHGPKQDSTHFWQAAERGWIALRFLDLS